MIVSPIERITRLIRLREILQKAMLKRQLGEAERGNKGDTARIMWRLAKALVLDGEHEQATHVANTARNIRQNVQGERFSRLPDDDKSYNLTVFVAFR